MTFSEKLNEYIDLLGISYSRLAKASGLSTSTISHYVRGEREPAGKSEQMEKIIGGILAAAKEKDILLSENALRAELLDTVNDGLNIEYDAYLFNLNLLLFQRKFITEGTGDMFYLFFFIKPIPTPVIINVENNGICRTLFNRNFMETVGAVIIKNICTNTVNLLTAIITFI